MRLFKLDANIVLNDYVIDAERLSENNIRFRNMYLARFMSIPKTKIVNDIKYFYYSTEIKRYKL